MLHLENNTKKAEELRSWFHLPFSYQYHIIDPVSYSYGWRFYYCNIFSVIATSLLNHTVTNQWMPEPRKRLVSACLTCRVEHMVGWFGLVSNWIVDKFQVCIQNHKSIILAFKYLLTAIKFPRQNWIIGMIHLMRFSKQLIEFTCFREQNQGL